MSVKRIEIVERGGTLRLDLDGHATRPGEQDIAARILDAFRTGELISVDGQSMRVVDFDRAGAPNVVTATVVLEGKAP